MKINIGAVISLNVLAKPCLQLINKLIQNILTLRLCKNVCLKILMWILHELMLQTWNPHLKLIIDLMNYKSD